MRTSERDGGKLLSHALRDRFKFQMLDEPVNLLPCFELKMASDIAGIGGKLRV